MQSDQHSDAPQLPVAGAFATPLFTPWPGEARVCCFDHAFALSPSFIETAPYHSNEQSVLCLHRSVPHVAKLAAAVRLGLERRVRGGLRGGRQRVRRSSCCGMCENACLPRHAVEQRKGSWRRHSIDPTFGQSCVLQPAATAGVTYHSPAHAGTARARRRLTIFCRDISFHSQRTTRSAASHYRCDWLVPPLPRGSVLLPASHSC